MDITFAQIKEAIGDLCLEKWLVERQRAELAQQVAALKAAAEKKEPGQAET